MKHIVLAFAALAAWTAAAATPGRTATEAYVTNKIAEAVAALPASDFTSNNLELVETIQATAPMPDHIESTNMLLSTGLAGRTTINADLNITETPDPAYSVTTNELPYLPNVITARTTRASEDLLSYTYEGLVNGSHSWRTSLPADRWTSVWYGEACPSGITYNAMANLWYLHPGNGTTVEMPAADYPPLKVMIGEVPLVASYRMGMSTKVWTAAPYSWTDIQGGDYSDDFPHYKTNRFDIVKTRIVRRDEVPDWTMATNKPTYTAAEVGALPASKYLTTSHWYSGSGVSFFGVGTIYQSAGLHEDGYMDATESGGMASDWVPLVYNAQYKAKGIRYRRYRTSSGTNDTFDVTLTYPQESGTFATREWAEAKIVEMTPAPDFTTSNAELVATIEATTPAPGDYANVSNRAMSATSPQVVTNIVRDLSLGGIWDESLQVWWTPRMRNGSLTYEATTNVNLNAEN